MTSAEGSSSFKIADAYVLVGANLNERSVEQTINQAQRQIARSSLNIKVTLDKRTLNSSISTVRGDVKALQKDLNVKLGAKLDDKSWADAALGVLAATDQMGRDNDVKLRVNLDNASVLRADADLRAVTRGMAANDQVKLKIDGSSLSEADNEVERFSNHWTRLAQLVAGVALVGAGPIETLGLATFAGVFAGIGVAAEASDKDVQKSFKDMTQSAKETARSGFAPLAPELISLAEQGKVAVGDLENSFSRAGAALAPQLDTIGSDLIHAVERGVEGSEAQLNKLPPLANSIGKSFDTLGRGAEGFINNIDVSRSVHGWDTLTGAVGHLLPALSILLNTAEPVGSALINDLGGGAETLFREVGELNPVLSLAGNILQLLGPEISIVAPPVLALAVASKLLTGSWTDVAGAGNRLRGAVTDLPGLLERIGQGLGFTTAAANQKARAAAQLALDEANEAKAVDQAVVAEAADAVAQEASAKNAQALSLAKRQLAASTVEATEAQAAFDATTTEATFAMGPLGIALGVIGAGIALFAGRAKDAHPPAQDLSTDLERLADAAPGAAQGVLANDPALQKLINNARLAGVNVNSMIDAINGGATTTQRFTRTVQDQTDALGKQHIATTNLADGTVETAQALVKTGNTVSGLAKAVNNGTISWDQLDPAQRKAVSNYNNLNGIVNQLNTTQKGLATQQGALAAVTRTGQQQQQQWNNTATEAQNQTRAYGGALTSTALQIQNFAAQQKNGQFTMEDFVKAQVSAAGSFLQALQQQQQISENVIETEHARERASRQVAAAKNQEEQSINQVSDAEHSAMEAANSVADAEHSYEQSILAVADARAQERKAQQAERQAQAQYRQDLAAARAAELALSAARKQAVLDLQAEQRQVLDQGDTVAEAELRLFDAQQAVNQAGLAHSTLSLADLQRGKNLNSQNEQAYELLLQLAEAQHALNDAKAQQAQVDAQNASDQKKGVAGSQDVLQAQQNLASAQQQVQQGQQQLIDSKEAAVKASQSVAQAQYAEKQAHEAVAQAQYAQRQAQEAVRQASFAATQATDALSEANLQAQVATLNHKRAVQEASGSIDINTVAGNRNVTQLLNLFDAQLAAGKSTDQARAAVEREGHALGITKGNVDKVLDSIKNVQGKQATFGIVGTPSVNLSELINAAIKQGLNPRTLGFTSAEIGNARASGSGIFPTHAEGGPIGGIGTGTSDSNLIRASKGEHMWTADEVKAAGGHDAVFALRRAVKGYATGGPIGDGRAVIGANIMLTELGTMFAAAREAFSLTGVAPNPAVLPTLPKKNPPDFSFLFSGSASGDTASHSAIAAAAQAYARSILAQHGWGLDQMPPLIKLWNQESGWNPYAINPSSGAYGIPQSLGHGHPYNLGDYVAQVNWGENYIDSRYGSPAAAWAHEIGFNWYDDGGFLPPGLSIAVNNTGANEHKAVLTTDQWNAIGALAAAAASGKQAPQIHNHFLVESMAVATAVAAQSSAKTSWDLMTSVG